MNFSINLAKRGRFTIPASVRAHYGFLPGEKFDVAETAEGNLLMTRLTSGESWTMIVAQPECNEGTP